MVYTITVVAYGLTVGLRGAAEAASYPGGNAELLAGCVTLLSLLHVQEQGDDTKAARGCGRAKESGRAERQDKPTQDNMAPHRCETQARVIV